MNPLKRIGWRFYYSFQGYWKTQSFWVIWQTATIAVPIAIYPRYGIFNAIATLITLNLIDIGFSAVFENKRKVELLVSLYAAERVEKHEH